VSRLGRWLLAIVVLFGGRRRRRAERQAERKRIVAEAPGDSRAELAVAALLILTALAAIAFIVFLATDSLGGQTQLMGATLGACFLFFAAALIVAGNRVIATEYFEEDYPGAGTPEAQHEIDQIARESGDGITRKGLLRTTGATAIAAIGAALIAPIAGFGPFLKTRELQQAPWRRGRRLVDQHGKPYKASDITLDAFYTAFPEGAVSRELIGGPVVIVRVPPETLKLPRGRAAWAPGGIVAYSKVCTHAGCAVALYRKPTFPEVQPPRALVCPCHYSTFDPAQGAKVIFGPAGRPLPQLPLMVDAQGFLRAGGNLSSGPGPSWWGVRSGPARNRS
jgi:ubiquinol-cytochrome c reductase iron-sulfur subunit